MFKLWNKITGHIELSAPDLDPFQFVWLDSVIHVAHIILPTVDNPRYTMQDLTDSNMYLRLQ